MFNTTYLNAKHRIKIQNTRTKTQVYKENIEKTGTLCFKRG